MFPNTEKIIESGRQLLKKAEKYKSLPGNALLWFKKITFRQWIIAVAVLAGICVGLYFLFRSKPEPPPLPTVSVEPIEIKDMEIYGEYVGRIRAQQFVEIRARVEGYL